MATTTDLTTPYAHMIDPSTPTTLTATLDSAAGAARQDAVKFDERATALRHEASGLVDKDGMRSAAENMLAEAARHEETAEQRRGMAAAYENYSSGISA